MFRTSILALGLSVVAGCGIIDPDITDFDLSLPEFSYSMDSMQWGVEGDGQFPAVPCSPEEDICTEAVAMTCTGEGCAAYCNADSQCQATVQVALNREVNLLSERPELGTIEDQPILNVSIDSVEYRVNENTFNFDSPELTIYVAPLNVMSPSNPEARPIGTVRPIAAGTQMDWTAIDFTPQGEVNLKEFMGDYKSTFQIIVGAQIEVPPGAELPQGRAVVGVQIKAHAGL